MSVNGKDLFGVHLRGYHQKRFPAKRPNQKPDKDEDP